MIRSFRKFFEFAGRQSQNWYLGLLYEIIRCILEALQFAALLVVLDGLVRDNITTQTALLAFGIMLVSVIGTIIFWYLAHGKEGEGSYRMCEDKRIQIGNRMKYMPMGYFNSHSLGNLTSVSTATMSDLESMSFAIQQFRNQFGQTDITVYLISAFSCLLTDYIHCLQLHPNLG